MSDMIHGFGMISLIWSWYVTWMWWLVIKVAWLWHDKRFYIGYWKHESYVVRA